MRVSIKPDSLGTVRFLGCWPQNVFCDGERTDEQRVNEQGIPCWNAKCKVINEDEEDPRVVRFIMVGKKNPCEGIKRGSKVTFERVDMRWWSNYDGSKTVQTFFGDGMSEVA